MIWSTWSAASGQIWIFVNRFLEYANVIYLLKWFFPKLPTYPLFVIQYWLIINSNLYNNSDPLHENSHFHKTQNTPDCVQASRPRFYLSAYDMQNALLFLWILKNFVRLT